MSIMDEYTIVEGSKGFYIASPMELIGTLKPYSASSILQARLYDLSPAEYLRMMRDELGVRLINYESFIGYEFDTKKSATTHAKELTKRYKLLKKEIG